MMVDYETNPISHLFSVPAPKGTREKRGGEVWPKFANCFSEAGAGKSSPCPCKGQRMTAWGLCAVRNMRQRRRAGGLCGENRREDVKIRLFIDNVGSQSATMPLPGFLGFK